MSQTNKPIKDDLGNTIRRNKLYRYRVNYISTSGEEGTFGDTDERNGGWPYFSAHHSLWVQSATVTDLETGELLRHWTRHPELAMQASA